MQTRKIMTAMTCNEYLNRGPCSRVASAQHGNTFDNYQQVTNGQGVVNSPLPNLGGHMIYGNINNQTQYNPNQIKGLNDSIPHHPVNQYAAPFYRRKTRG